MSACKLFAKEEQLIWKALEGELRICLGSAPAPSRSSLRGWQGGRVVAEWWQSGRVVKWWQGGAEHSFSRLVPPLLAPLLPRLLRTTISNFGEHSLLTQTLHPITEQKLGLTPPSYQELKSPV